MWNLNSSSRRLHCSSRPSRNCCSLLSPLAFIQELKESTLASQADRFREFFFFGCSTCHGRISSADKYAEGYVHHRFYAGCDDVDAVEERRPELSRFASRFSVNLLRSTLIAGADANLVRIISNPCPKDSKSCCRKIREKDFSMN